MICSISQVKRIMASATALAVPSLRAIRSDSRWGMSHFVCDAGGVSPQLLQEQSGQPSIIFQVRVSDMHSIPEDQAVVFSYTRSTPTATSPALSLVAIVPAIKLYALVGGKIRYHTTVKRYYQVPINCCPMRFPSCPTQYLDRWLGIDGLISNFQHLSQVASTTCFDLNWNGICALGSNMQKYPWILVPKSSAKDKKSKITLKLEQDPIILCTTQSAWIHAACDLLPLTSMQYPENEFITQTGLPVGFLFAPRPPSVDVAWHSAAFQQHFSWYPANLVAPPNSIVPSILQPILPRLQLWEGDHDQGIHQMDPPLNIPEFSLYQIENYIDEYLDCIQEIALHRGRKTTYQERFLTHYRVYNPVGYTGMIMMVHAFHYFPPLFPPSQFRFWEEQILQYRLLYSSDSLLRAFMINLDLVDEQEYVLRLPRNYCWSLIARRHPLVHLVPPNFVDIHHFKEPHLHQILLRSFVHQVSLQYQRHQARYEHEPIPALESLQRIIRMTAWKLHHHLGRCMVLDQNVPPGDAAVSSLGSTSCTTNWPPCMQKCWQWVQCPSSRTCKGKQHMEWRQQFHYFLFLLQIRYPPEPIIQHFQSMFGVPSKYPTADWQSIQNNIRNVSMKGQHRKYQCSCEAMQGVACDLHDLEDCKKVCSSLPGKCSPMRCYRARCQASRPPVVTAATAGVEMQSELKCGDCTGCGADVGALANQMDTEIP